MRNKLRSSKRVRNVLGILVSGVISILVVVLYGLRDYPHFFNFNPPFEDASMLFRYANIFAHGGGIAWNFGENPGVTDGATDLGFVLVLGGLVRLGATVIQAAALVNLASIFGIGAFFWYFLKKFSSSTPFLFVILSVLIVSSGPLDRYVKSGFSPTVLALIYLVIVGKTLLISPSQINLHKRMVVIGSLCGISGWWRPEGFFFSILLTAASFFTLLHFKKIEPKIMRGYFLWLLTPYAALLFFWSLFRFLYFGHLLPTSAVMKAETGIHFGNFSNALRFWLLLLAPLICLAVLYVSGRLTIFYLAISAFTVSMALCWILVSTTLNWWNRMQWPFIPSFVLIILFSIIESPRFVITKTKRSLFIFSIITFFALVGQSFVHKNEFVQFPDFTKSLSSSLARVNTSNIRLATTEAGLIPLSVTGRSLDAYGWNDYAIARSDGSALSARLLKFSPNLIILHGLPPSKTVSYSCAINYFTPKWNIMSRTIVAYVDTHHLVLFRSILTGRCDAWSIYIASSLPADVQKAIKTFRINGRDLVGL